MDNLNQGTDNSSPAEAGLVDSPASSLPAPVTPMGSEFSWKGKLQGDMAKAPSLSKFDDTPDGLNKAMESYHNLEKLLGHEKVPIPKDANDVEGWSRFSKAMGIPDKAEQYGLADAQIPDAMKGLTFDKQKFAETVHAFKLTPNQAKGLWEAYTKQNMEAYGKAMEAKKSDMVKVVNELKSKWGDAYEGNVNLGQMVINKFSSDKETADYLSVVLTQNPKAIEFLAKIGEQFSENKIGDFGYQRFSLSPEQAGAEIDSILANKNHAYNNEKASKAEHQEAVNYVNSLYAKKFSNMGKG
jgi:hypothetical protein